MPPYLMLINLTSRPYLDDFNNHLISSYRVNDAPFPYPLFISFTVFHLFPAFRQFVDGLLHSLSVGAGNFSQSFKCCSCVDHFEHGDIINDSLLLVKYYFTIGK